MRDFKTAMQQYLKAEIEVMQHLDWDALNLAMNAIVDAFERDATIYIFGNGGSGSTASHYANDFNKAISEKAGRKFRFISLCDNMPTILAIANDFSYSEIFRYQLDGTLRPGDLVIGISGSGNSENIIRAVEYAKEQGNTVIGITGYQGGKLKELADYHMDAMVDDMSISEDLHMIFDHMMVNVLGKAL